MYDIEIKFDMIWYDMIWYNLRPACVYFLTALKLPFCQVILHISCNIFLMFCFLPPGKYYYEATVTDEGLCRVGWSTSKATLDLGKSKLQSVLPTPRFTRPIGLLWNPLLRIKKLLGGWPKIGLLFIRLPAAALFSSNLPVSCQFREFLSLFNAQDHSFHQFQGLRRPKEQSILIIHFSRKSTI